MYTTWWMFNSLVRQYCKVDHSDPKPLTFQQLCNARLLQIMGVLNALDDPRYARSHILHTAGGAIYRDVISDVNVGNKTIDQASLNWSLGTIVTGVLRSAGVYSHVVARVVAKNGNLSTLEILSGALVDEAVLTDAYLVATGILPGNWDSASLRIRKIRGVMDYEIEDGAGTERSWFQYLRTDLFREIAQDFGMLSEVGYYNHGGVLQVAAGEDGATVSVPVLEFDCIPSLYTAKTERNRIELLPEHLRMLFDGVASTVLKMKNKPQPEDLRARMDDDLARFYTAKREETVRKVAREQKVTE